MPRPSRTAPPWRRPPEPACVSGTHTGDTESHLDTQPAREPFLCKAHCKEQSVQSGSPGPQFSLGCNPGSCQKPRCSVSSSARRRIETSASTPSAQAGSGLSSASRPSPGAVTQMRAGDSPVKTHRQVMMAAGTEVISSQEAGKTHINTRRPLPAKAPVPGGLPQSSDP